MDRKELKRRGREVAKSHYWILLLACLVACILGTRFTDSLDFLSIRNDSNTENTQENDPNYNSSVRTGFGLDEVIDSIVDNNVKKWEKQTENNEIAESKKKETEYGILKIGSNRGVLAGFVNKMKSGSLYAMIIVTIQTLTRSNNQIAAAIFILLAFIVLLAAWAFVENTYSVIYSRMFLEARIYKKVPIRRFLFLVRVRQWVSVTRVMFRKTIYVFLWNLTIVGGIIKTYSYSMVQFILAENPTLNAKQAITLSRRMMNGHKFELFKLQISFILWGILNNLTLGISRLVWYNAYSTATYTEFYVMLRNDYIEKKGEGYEYFCDRYLYEHADEELLTEAYADIIALKNEERFEYEEKSPVKRFLRNIFGIVVSYDGNELKRREQEVKDANLRTFKEVISGEVYPGRLFIKPEKSKIKTMSNLRYLRCYSITSVILIFFFFCMVGWTWEVSLHLITDGEFVNRGTCYGPWLPIYGFGGTLILLLLYSFRKKPWLEFVLAMVLAGGVEYYTSYRLEKLHDGMKWWDYKGYFLNLNGRVCAEGLLVFGLGGIAIVYIIAPMLDNQFSKIPKKVIIPICIVLLACYGADQIYSIGHPNTGKGITDYDEKGQIGNQRKDIGINNLYHIRI